MSLPFPDLAKSAATQVAPAPVESKHKRNPIQERFRLLEHNFNKTFLVTLHQIKSIVEGEPDPEDVRHTQLLENAYEHWFEKLQAEPDNLDAVLQMHELVGNNHALMIARDESLFTLNGRDFFTDLFNDEVLFSYPDACLNTVYLVNQLATGLEDDEDTDGEEEQEDARANLWDALKGLYRLCVLICVYQRNPLLKELIDVITISSSGTDMRSMLPNMMKNLKNKSSFRRLLMKVMNTNADFEDLFSEMRKVFAVLSPETEAGSGPTAAQIGEHKTQLFTVEWTQQHLNMIPDSKTRQAVAASLSAAEWPGRTDLETEHKLSEAQAEEVLSAAKRSWRMYRRQHQELKMPSHTVISDLMDAITEQDGDSMQDIMAEYGVDMNTEEMQRLQDDLKQMTDQLETEAAATTDTTDCVVSPTAS